MAKKINPVRISEVKIGFKSTNELVITKNIGKNILSWGKNNRWPSYLLSLYKGQPQHQGIVNGKAKYITGLKIKASTPQGQEFVDRWNPKESAIQVYKKANKNFTLYGARAIKVVPNQLGTPLWFFHLEYGRCRMSICGTIVKYCQDWDKEFEYGVQEYPVWYPGCKEVAVYIHKNYNQTVTDLESFYPEQEYEAAIKDIDTLKRIANSRNSLVINDFSAGSVIVVKGGRPETKEEEKILVDKIKRNYTGDEQQGNAAVVFVDPGTDSGVEFAAAPTNDLDKKYIEVTNACTKNVYSAHDVPPELFKYIADSAPMFDRNKLVEQNEQFMNAYVIPEQESYLKEVEMFFNLKYPGLECKFEIEQFKPVGVNALDPEVSKHMTPDEIRKSLGLAPLAGATMNGGDVQIEQAQVNDNLKNLTGKQTQGIMRIVRKYDKGEYSETQAKLLLKSGFGLTDQECNEFLEIVQQAEPIRNRLQFSQEIGFINAIRKNKYSIPDSDEIVSTKFVSDSEGRSLIDVLKGFIDDLPAPTQVDGVTYEYYTAFTYGLAEGVKGPVILPTTRQWCRDMYNEFKLKKDAITIETIEKMSNDFGMNAFNYRGGFYNNGEEITPWCRHVWIAHTVRRKV